MTVVGFLDPACFACGDVQLQAREIVDRHPNRVRVMLRYAHLRPGSDVAVRILEAARRQDIFEEVLDALLANRADWAGGSYPDPGTMWRLADEAGLDPIRARIDVLVDLSQTAALIERDEDAVAALGIRSIPAFFVGGESLTEVSAGGLVAAVQAAVDDADAPLRKH